MRKLLLALALLSLAGSQLQAAEWKTRPNCDNPSPNLKDLKTANIEECQAQCDSVAECKAVVYVSGWNKCWLKKADRQASLKFISAELNADHSYVAGSFKTDNDHTGKDLERKVLGSPDECGKACAENASCGSYTYLEGYKVCWLKKKGGRFNPKVFYCGQKS